MTAVISNVQEEKKGAGATSQVRDTLVIWYHQMDENLLLTLDPHLQVLALRLNNRFQLNYFRSPKDIPQPPMEKDSSYMREQKEEAVKHYQGKYAGIMQSFSRAALFLPCVSPAFMLQFWKDYERDPRLQTYLTQPTFPILPIPTRPMAGVTTPYLEKPLSTYAEGHERETACATVATSIEAALLKFYPVERSIQAPFLMLEAPQEAPRTLKRSRFFSFKNL